MPLTLTGGAGRNAPRSDLTVDIAATHMVARVLLAKSARKAVLIVASSRQEVDGAIAQQRPIPDVQTWSFARNSATLCTEPYILNMNEVPRS